MRACVVHVAGAIIMEGEKEEAKKGRQKRKYFVPKTRRKCFSSCKVFVGNISFRVSTW